MIIATFIAAPISFEKSLAPSLNDLAKTSAWISPSDLRDFSTSKLPSASLGPSIPFFCDSCISSFSAFCEAFWSWSSSVYSRAPSCNSLNLSAGIFNPNFFITELAVDKIPVVIPVKSFIFSSFSILDWRVASISSKMCLLFIASWSWSACALVIPPFITDIDVSFLSLLSKATPYNCFPCLSKVNCCLAILRLESEIAFFFTNASNSFILNLLIPSWSFLSVSAIFWIFFNSLEVMAKFMFVLPISLRTFTIFSYVLLADFPTLSNFFSTWSIPSTNLITALSASPKEVIKLWAVSPSKGFACFKSAYPLLISLRRLDTCWYFLGSNSDGLSGITIVFYYKY